MCTTLEMFSSLAWQYTKGEFSFTNLLVANKLADVSTRCSNLLQSRESVAPEED